MWHCFIDNECKIVFVYISTLKMRFKLSYLPGPQTQHMCILKSGVIPLHSPSVLFTTLSHRLIHQNEVIAK